MPLMMPAAVTGIHIIWIAQIVAPIGPNSMRFTASIRPTPCQPKRVYRLCSIQSSGVP